MDGPEQLGLTSFAPHPDVAPTLVLGVAEAKRYPHYNVRPDKDLAVGVMNVRGSVVNFSYQVP